jgi:hypothetical protein
MTEMQMTETGDLQAVGTEQRFLALPSWSWRHSDFEFVSYFDVRISDFRPSWVAATGRVRTRVGKEDLSPDRSGLSSS